MAQNEADILGKAGGGAQLGVNAGGKAEWGRQGARCEGATHPSRQPARDLKADLPQRGETSEHCQELLWKWVLLPLSEASRVSGPRKWSSSFTFDRIFNEHPGSVTLALARCSLPTQGGTSPSPVEDPPVPPEQQAPDSICCHH